jgi:alkanesulfonate monooxygenase
VPVEFIGIARTADRSETIAETGPAVEPEYLYHLAATHEQSGFDRVLVAHRAAACPRPAAAIDAGVRSS